MTSAEPSRTALYSSDISWRVVWQRAGMGMNFQAIAAHLQIAVGIAHPEAYDMRVVIIGGLNW